MSELTIEAGTLPVAHGIYSALSEFHPGLTGGHDEGYRVTVELGSDDRRLGGILDGIQEHVTARDNGPARIDLDGHRYTFHAR
jgi:hypothetical protein